MGEHGWQKRLPTKQNCPKINPHFRETVYQMADSGYKSISRIDVPHKKMHGWYVRVYYKGQMHAKFFSDSRYDGPDEGLAESIR
jgi:hypothetical protein